jgi:hypothetical protein
VRAKPEHAALLHRPIAGPLTATPENGNMVALEGELADAAYTLDALVEHSRSLEEIRKDELRCGDRVVVTTRNSRYTIWALGDGHYWVWGGWFDRRGVSPCRVTINGCTWGGSAIKHDVLVARGLFLEFGNRVLTTRIQNVCVIPAQADRTLN